ncbi:MAG TPA: hypothetical protein VHH35_13300, partial [Pyrinomonadaceae bacterium]|nr:hypothetical protein [Pyrinomonadaceae bacterium]
NPASIVPTALLNFTIFTALAIALELPVAHLIAASCLGVAYIVTYHVLVGHIPWENLRVMSLLEVSLSVSSGQAWAGAFVLFIAASEWLLRRKRQRDADYYVLAAALIGSLSLALVTLFGKLAGEDHSLWIVYGIYSLGAFWIAARRSLVPLAWAGSGLLLVALADAFAYPLSASFPWQTAMLAHAMLCAIGAIVSSRDSRVKILSEPLNYSAMISLLFAVISLFEANEWARTAQQAQRVFWIAGTLLVLLWLNRKRFFFNAFQIALTCAVVLTVKAALQQFDWYSYLPHAFLHPTALQIQGTVLTLLVLGWIALRIAVRRNLPDELDHWLNDAKRLLDDEYSIDRLMTWALAVAFLLLAVYGAFAGVTQELAALGSGYRGFDVAGFPHQEALGIGSWIVLGLLTITMLVNFMERRREVYLLGALAVLSAAIPLIAGLFESQVATATAWRWLAALFLIAGSLAIWKRGFSKDLRSLLIVLTVAPLLVLTIYPALRAINYLPIQGPVSGIFASLSDGFSYGAPLVLVAFVMIGYAVRERKAEFAFFGGVFFNLTVTLAFLLAVVEAQGSMDRVVLIRVMQLNAIAFAAYALPWLATRHRWLGALNKEETAISDSLFKAQIALAIVLNVLIFAPIAFGLVIDPIGSGRGTAAAGSFLGWLTFLVTLAGIGWLRRARGQKVPPVALAGALWGISCLTAFASADVSRWLALHVLTVAVTASAGVLVTAAFAAPAGPSDWFRSVFALDEKWASHSRLLAVITGSAAVFLSLRTLTDSNATRWWSIGPLLGLTAMAAALNWQTLRRRYLYVAGGLLTLATTLWWIFIYHDHRWLSTFLYTNIIAASLGGILWLWLELRARRLRPAPAFAVALSFHNVVAIASTALFILIVVFTFGTSDPITLTMEPRLTWLAFASALALMVATLWDRSAKYTVAGLYVFGLLAGAIAVYQLDLRTDLQLWSITVLLALYALIVSLLWKRREALIAYAARFGIPRRIPAEAPDLKWLSAFTIISVAIVATLSYWIDLHFVQFHL